MNLAILCPSRGRPQMARKMQDSFPCPVFFYLDDDDPQLDEYDVENKFIGPSTQITYATHILWRQHPDFHAYLLCGDDGVCRSPDILRSLDIYTAIYPDGIWVAGPADGRAENSFPHPIVSRRWAETLGYVIPPIFLHWYNDTRLVDLARALGRFVDMSKTVLIEHETPKTGKNPIDETFKRIRSGLRHERDTFVASFSRYFNADLECLSRAIYESQSYNDVPRGGGIRKAVS